ncbi:peroxidase-related enzyme [Lutimonas vermicola]|uniref:Peroxidase-related enzyme n=1 Tax=Lutimonas vermicola TaxID=414288 RepID=A0ABU9L088_9FLAO
MFWIDHINYKDADSSLRKIYDRVSGPGNKVDNILMAHSLRPHTLLGHMALYKNVIHNSNNTLPKWYLEAVGIYVSYLNHCDYCVDHHFTGLKRLWNDQKKSENFMIAIKKNTLQEFFDKKWFEGIVYAHLLTMNPRKINKNDIYRLRAVNFSDAEILEVNQVVGYFNYANRTVLGLGVHTEGDVLGLSPNNSDDPENWNHD